MFNKIRFLAAVLISATILAATALADTGPRVLWYDKPAADWEKQALPIGNGPLGAMIFGTTGSERLQFNVDSLWEGNEDDTGAYQTFGDVLVKLGHDTVTNYRRQLDIARAVHTVTYQHKGVTYRREAFASHPAGVIVLRLTADKPGTYTGRVILTDMHAGQVTAAENLLLAEGKLQNGMQYEAQLLVAGQGGRVAVSGDLKEVSSGDIPGFRDGRNRTLPAAAIKFDRCDGLTLILAAETNYLADHTNRWRRDHPHDRIAKRIAAAAKIPCEQLLKEHVADFQSLFGRVQLDAGATAAERSALPTNRRLAKYREQSLLESGGAALAADPDLEELFFQYGRYLLVSCSRAGGLPANLQGVWNDKNRPPWRSDYHSNINVQMNYWPAEPTNLAECHRVFIDYVLSQRPVAIRRTRKQFGDVPGWTIQTENGIHGGGSWRWNPPGSAWHAQHMWEHYAFSLDKDYLAKVAYPVLKEVCQFWEARLKRLDDGTLVVVGGWSPEHGPTEDGVSYDQQIVYDLFTNYIDAAGALGIDGQYREKIAQMRGKLLPPKIGRWGQLQEWMVDRDSQKDNHRHVSHLFALHPGRQIAPATTPELARAAQVSLNGRGDGGTGWSKAWKINFWARLLDGDHSYKMLSELLKRSTFDNLYDAHPPFQIDGNFGATSGVAEMLLQSHDGTIALLPALPTAWPSGKVMGMRARGGVEVDITWTGGKATSAVLRATADGKHKIRAPKGQQLDGPEEIELKAGQTYEVKFK